MHILNEGGTIAPLNHTFIALIPKIEKSRKVTEYRPISLCNVIYKIVVKTIANRLKHVLHHIISPTQSVFIPKRLSSDNIIIGYECLHKIRFSSGKKNGFVALKLDLIHPHRGLQQGCPLFSYLFILCAEAFSNLLVQAKSRHLIHGLNFSRDLSISHLLFADDNLIFTKATTEDCTNLKPSLIVMLQHLDKFSIMRNHQCFLVEMFMQIKLPL